MKCTEHHGSQESGSGAAPVEEAFANRTHRIENLGIESPVPELSCGNIDSRGLFEKFCQQGHDFFGCGVGEFRARDRDCYRGDVDAVDREAAKACGEGWFLDRNRDHTLQECGMTVA